MTAYGVDLVFPDDVGEPPYEPWERGGDPALPPTGERPDNPNGAGSPATDTVIPARCFERVDVADIARNGVPDPVRHSGGLVYRGSLHSLDGAPDSGKSTVVYWWMLGLIRAGDVVAFLDEEAGREQFVEKMTAIGATADDLERVVYVDFPGRAWDSADMQGLLELLRPEQPALVAWDSASAFLTTAGLDEDKNRDAGRFYKTVLLRLARDLDTAVVIIDHIDKAATNGRYARGASAKLGLVDVHFRLEAKRPFHRGQSGLLLLTVTKDRRGYLHRHHEILVDVDNGITLTFTEVESSNAAAAGGSTGAAPQISKAGAKLLEVLTASPDPILAIDIVDGVVKRFGHGLRRETVSRELAKLRDAGLVDEFDVGPRGSKRWVATCNLEAATAAADLWTTSPQDPPEPTPDPLPLTCDECDIT